MRRRRRKKKKRPSIAGLVDIRRRMKDEIDYLEQARKRSTSVVEKQQINTAIATIKGKMHQITNTLASIDGFRQKRKKYESRIAVLEKKIETRVGRQFRAGERWLRRWERLGEKST